MVRSVGIAGAGFLLLYAVLSVATGQRVVLLGDLAQLIPPLAYAALTLRLGRRSRGQVSVFWNLNAVYALMWTFGQDLYGRACQIRPEMARRFIFITGDIDGQDTREFLDRSRCSYFMKPFNLERLTAAVDQLTGSRTPDTIG
jgi:hypothetical protein